MARTIAQIQQSIIDAKNADPILAGLNSTSNTAIWLLWTWVIAFVMHVQETFFDDHKSEVVSLIDSERAHTEKWYIQKAKAFQFGDSLPADSDVYNPIDATHCVVAYAATQEINGVLRLKVAMDTAGLPDALGAPQAIALTAYMEIVKDAGVHLSITSQPGDDLQLTMHLFYNPLVLDNTGSRLDGTSATPVRDAVKLFLTKLPFNGLFVINRLVNAIEAVEGIEIAEISLAQSQYGGGGYVTIVTQVIPDAGYFVLDEGFFNGAQTYSAHEPI